MLLKISKSALETKVFGRTEAQIREVFTGEELEKELLTLPTEEEENWMRVWNSTAAGLERTKRKMQICAFVEVEEMREDFFSYSFDGKKYEINSPYNPLKCSEALDRSTHAGFEEMARQGCIKVDNVLYDPKKSQLAVDELQLLKTNINRFFFQIYMG